MTSRREGLRNRPYQRVISSASSSSESESEDEVAVQLASSDMDGELRVSLKNLVTIVLWMSHA